MVKVAAGFIRKDHQVLLCQRGKTKAHGGKWEFPGGKQEPGETMLQTLRREIQEELAVDIRPVEIITELTFAYPEITVELSLVLADLPPEQTPVLSEHSAFVWADEDTLFQYDLCEADRQMAEHLRGKLSQLLK